MTDLIGRLVAVAGESARSHRQHADLQRCRSPEAPEPPAPPAQGPRRADPAAAADPLHADADLRRPRSVVRAPTPVRDRTLPGRRRDAVPDFAAAAAAVLSRRARPPRSGFRCLGASSPSPTGRGCFGVRILPGRRRAVPDFHAFSRCFRRSPPLRSGFSRPQRLHQSSSPSSVPCRGHGRFRVRR